MGSKRPRLVEVTLTGPRALIRRALGWALVGLPIIGAIGYVLPAHQLRDEVLHSNYADGGVVSLLIFLVVCAVAVALRRRRFGAGIVTGGIAMAGAVGALVPVMLVHLFEDTKDGFGEGMFAVGILGLFLVGAASLLSEPILYILERRRIMRDLEPVIPAARLVHS